MYIYIYIYICIRATATAVNSQHLNLGITRVRSYSLLSRSFIVLALVLFQSGKIGPAPGNPEL